MAGTKLGGHPCGSPILEGKGMHLIDLMSWFDEGFTMVALYAMPWILK
jgi:hypothetical protein